MNRQPSDAERYGDMEPVEESLILSSIVGRREVDLENIFKSLTSWGDEHYTSPRAFNHERTIEVHCPVFKLLDDGRILGFCPLGYEVDECLGLDSIRGWKLSSKDPSSTTHFAILPVASRL